MCIPASVVFFVGGMFVGAVGLAVVAVWNNSRSKR